MNAIDKQRLRRAAEALDKDIARQARTDQEPLDTHRNVPEPDPRCLYGLVGEVGLAAGKTTEANPFAVAANAMAFLSAAVGRGPYLLVGNTTHHARLFTLHVGRSGRGRKGDAASLVRRLEQAIKARSLAAAPKVHSGGLSSREGLAFLIHDGYMDGAKEVEPIHDKRLWVLESEFANVLHQSKRDGNTLSTALRDCWDGVSIKPATKTNRMHATDPHVCLSGAVTPGELRELIAARDLSNGFANRFLILWAERTRMTPFPRPTPQERVDELVSRIIKVLESCHALDPDAANSLPVSLSAAAQLRYSELYLGELNDTSHGERINGMLERRAPMLLRIAMLFALCDLTAEITLAHIEAALAWIRFGVESVKYIFASALDEVQVAEINDLADKIVTHLQVKVQATRSQISRECFHGHISADRLDAAIDALLSTTPPRLELEIIPRPKGNPGNPTKQYRLPSAKAAESAQCQQPRQLPDDLPACEASETSEVLLDAVSSSFRSLRNEADPARSQASIDVALSSQISPGEFEVPEEIL